MKTNIIICGDALEELRKLPDEYIDCVITSPPYWRLRDYGVEGQLGIESSFEEYLTKLITIFGEIKRILKFDGTIWVNLGDIYGTGSGKDANRVYGKKSTKKFTRIDGVPKVIGFEKSLLLIPERFAVAMCNHGYLLRNKIIWHKKNAMPSSVLDRLSNKYEMVYFFTKSKRYFFDLDSIRIPYETAENRPDGIVRAREYGYNTKQGTKRRKMEEDSRKFGKRRPPENEYERNPKGKNPGDVWTLTLQPHSDQHIAMFPEKLVLPMIKAGCPKGGIVLDPFCGSGTALAVAQKSGRQYIGIDLNEEYCEMARNKLKQDILL